MIYVIIRFNAHDIACRVFSVPTKYTKSIIDDNDHHVHCGQVMSCVHGVRGTHVTSTMNPEHHRERSSFLERKGTTF